MAPERRTTSVRAMAFYRLGVDAREKWINGLDHLTSILSDPGHFVDILVAADRSAVYDVLDLVDDVRGGRHDGEKNTDPRLYRILVDSTAEFERHGYLQLPHDAIMDFF